MEHHPDNRRLLATDNFISVEQCRCGMLHLTLGALSLKISPEALDTLGEVITHSLTVLQEEVAEAQSQRLTVRSGKVGLA